MYNSLISSVFPIAQLIVLNERSPSNPRQMLELFFSVLLIKLRITCSYSRSLVTIQKNRRVLKLVSSSNPRIFFTIIFFTITSGMIYSPRHSSLRIPNAPRTRMSSYFPQNTPEGDQRKSVSKFFD